jgi:orotidine-5'-phosphate decarboxylase
VPVILDAKRGDIGATAEQYAREAFERYQADAVTLSPFMGFDSIEPYLRYDGKGLILLCRTSNPGGSDLQAQRAGRRRAAVRAHREAGRRPLEPQRPARPGGGRHLPAGDRPRARTGAHAAAADPGHRCTGRRRRRHRARRLASLYASAIPILFRTAP